jgi:radical SAM/SPASM domain protein of ACGX system
MGNPFHLTDEVCQKLKAHGCERYQLSIDGMKRTHDRLRMSGSFEATVAGISTLNRAGIRSVVMATVSKINIREIPAIIDLVVERAVNVFAFARYCPTGRDRVNHVEPDAYRKLLAICWDRYERYKDSGTAFILKDHLWTLYLHEKGLFAIPDGLEDKVVYDGCNCGISHLTILSNGDVYACRRMDSKVGNVLTNRLGDVWGGAGMERFREYGAFKKCAKCELLRFCRGCPAIAYSITGDFYAADPQCWKEISV